MRTHVARPRGYSLVELTVTLALSGAILIFALVTLVTVVRASQRAALTTALAAERDAVVVRFLDDVSRAGTGVGAMRDAALVVDDDGRGLALTRPAQPVARDVVAALADGTAPATPLVRVTWRLDGRVLTRRACATDDESACVVARESERVAGFDVRWFDDDGRPADAARATRARLVLALAASSGTSPVEVTAIDEARLGGAR